jgi:hypothetical protein
MSAVRARDEEARRLETELANERARHAASGTAAPSANQAETTAPPSSTPPSSPPPGAGPY